MSVKAYKLLRVMKSQPGKVFPLFVFADEATPIGEWLPAKEGPRYASDGKVKSKLGHLAFRPGWHISDVPLAIHIGEKENGKIKYMHEDNVWCECEYLDDVDYQEEADQNGWKNGRFNKVQAMLKHIPENGYYRYKTSAQMLGTWVIAGNMKINRILTDEEVEDICRKHGYEPLPRRNGPMDMTQYGFAYKEGADGYRKVEPFFNLV